MGNYEFTELATVLVADHAHLPVSDVYVVWLVKVLQNNKALLSTTRSDGMYYEVTLNGTDQQVYLDAYVKEENIAFDINELTK